MVGFDAAFRSRCLGEQDLEHAPGNANDAFILADADAEFDGVPAGVPPGVWREAEEHGPPTICSANVLTKMPPMHWRCPVLRSVAVAQLRGEYLTADTKIGGLIGPAPRC